MQHKRIAALAFKRVNDLRIARGTQRYSTNCLGFTAREQGAAMHFGQHIHFTGDGTHGAIVTAVDTVFARQYTLAHQSLLNLLEKFLHVISRWAACSRQCGNRCITNSANALIACRLLCDAIGLAKFSLDLGLYCSQQLGIDRRR